MTWYLCYSILLFDSSLDNTQVIYIHSILPSNDVTVFKNSTFTCEDTLLSIFFGRAHITNNIPFGTIRVKGWTDAWKIHQSFPGEIDYKTVHCLWSPSTRQLFGPNFQAMVTTLLLCHKQRIKRPTFQFLQQQQSTNPLSTLPDDIIMHILKMCPWDWADDTTETIRKHQQKQNPLPIRVVLARSIPCSESDESDGWYYAFGGERDSVCVYIENET